MNDETRISPLGDDDMTHRSAAGSDRARAEDGGAMADHSTGFDHNNSANSDQRAENRGAENGGLPNEPQWPYREADTAVVGGPFQRPTPQVTYPSLPVNEAHTQTGAAAPNAAQAGPGQPGVHQPGMNFSSVNPAGSHAVGHASAGFGANGYPSSGFPSNGYGPAQPGWGGAPAHQAAGPYGSAGNGSNGFGSNGFGAQAYASGGYPSAPVDQAPTMDAPKPKRTPTLLAGATILMALVVAGCLVLFFTQRKGQVPTASSSGASISAAPTSGGSSTPSTSASTTSPASSSEASTSAASYAEFPASAGWRCSQGGSIDTTVVRPIGQNQGQTCGFLNNIKDQALQVIQSNPQTTNFTLNVSSAATGYVYQLSCSRADHLSHCEGLGLNARRVGAYVKDSMS